MFQLLTDIIYTVYYRWKEQSKVRFEKKYQYNKIYKPYIVGNYKLYKF